jgi:hypothetical protein
MLYPIIKQEAKFIMNQTYVIAGETHLPTPAHLVQEIG